MAIQKSFGHVIIFIQDKLMVIPSLYSLNDGAEDGGNSRLSALLNLVEAFEPIATDTPGEGAKFDVGTKDNPKFYTNPEDLFVGRDPRLAGDNSVSRFFF